MIRRFWERRVAGAILTAGVCAFGMSGAAAHAESITTAAGNGADAYVISGSPDSNFGTSGDLQVKNDGSNDAFNRKTYLRFDLTQFTSFTHAAGGSSLTLTYDGNPAPSSVTWNYTDTTFSYELFGLNNGTAGDASGGWTESGITGITWNNAPGNTTTDGTTFSSSVATDLGSATIAIEPSAGTTLTFSSAALTNFLNADTNGLVTLMVVRNTPPQNGANGYLDFASKENTGRFAAPTLSVSAAPLPGAIPGFAVLASGLAAAGWWNGRRRSRRPDLQ